MTTATDTIAPPSTIVGVAIWSKAPRMLADWYTTVLGFEFDERRHDDGRWHFICRDSAVAWEIKGETTPDGYGAPDLPRKAARCGISVTETSFEVADVDAAISAAVDGGGELLLEPEDHSWGRFATVLDPERNRVGLWKGV